MRTLLTPSIDKMRARMRSIPIFIAVLLFTPFAIASTAEWQSLTSIRLQAERFLDDYDYSGRYPPQFELGQLDSRLRLKACDSDLKIGFTRPERDRGNTSLTLRCAGPTRWKLHLPVSVRLFDDVMVTRSPVSRGAAIDPARLQSRKLEVSAFRSGYYRPGDPLQRLQARRNLPTGTALTPQNVEPRLAVRSGEQVTILLTLQGLDIKSRGKALQSGPIGKVIRVRNEQSGRVIEGEITAPGQIRVGL